MSKLEENILETLDVTDMAINRLKRTLDEQQVFGGYRIPWEPDGEDRVSEKHEHEAYHLDDFVGEEDYEGR